MAPPTVPSMPPRTVPAVRLPPVALAMTLPSTAPPAPPATPPLGARMDAFRATILGIVQGLTEFLPISSTAHLKIVPSLLGWPDPGAEFTAVIQLGTLLAVLCYFRQDIVRLIVGFVRGLWTG